MGFVALPSSFAEPEPPGVPAPPGAPSTQPGPLEQDQQSRVYFKIPVANEFVRMQTRFTVPPKPARVGTMFLWPGLEPREGGRNYYPIGLGVLQPVLTWGPACAPVQQPPTYSTWWISGQYVNVYSNDPRYRGCHSGRAMSVKVGEVLEMDIALDQSTGLWTQTITGQAGSVRYSINLRKQAQNMALFAIEPWDNARLADRLVFSGTTLTFRDEAAQSCLNPELTYTGTGGTISPPTADRRRAPLPHRHRHRQRPAECGLTASAGGEIGSRPRGCGSTVTACIHRSRAPPRACRSPRCRRPATLPRR